MRGARFYRPDVPTRLKKCSEHIGDDCTGCCGPTPCTYCLELELYGEGIQYGTAEASGTHWIGTVGGHDFDAFWERNYETDACEFVVEFGGEEVYRSPCYGNISCRDSSDEASVVIDYEEGTLRWTKHEALELPHVAGDAGCPTWFCGECECSCDCLCITITEPDGNVIRGDICNTSYPCDGPVWEGSIGYYDLSLALGADSYGNCVVAPTVGGEELDAVEVTGCKDMSGSIELYDGTVIAFRCKVCDCEEETVTLCCGGRNLAGSLFLRLVYPGTSATVECGDSFVTLADAGGGDWYGDATVTVEVPGGGGEECVTMEAYFHFYCDPAGPVYFLDWYIVYLGTRYPATGWSSLDRAGEDCNYPYLGTFEEPAGGGLTFWNGTITFLVSEVAI